MGGRGSSSGGTGIPIGATYVGGGGGGGGVFTSTPISNQPATPQNTPVVPNAVTVLTQMSDQQLAQLYNQSQRVDMPNHLADVSDQTQKFVYMAGLNEKPLVLSDADFAKYMRDNNIRQSQVLARSVGGADYTVNGTNIQMSAKQVADLTKYGELNYIGGKHGGMAYGAGTYFDMNGGRPSGYGYGGVGKGGLETMVGVLSKNAHPITKSALQSQIPAWSRSHPQFARAVGSVSNRNISVYALAMGYNVITNGGGYHNVIDRSAVVLRQSNY